ncbi:Metallo-dependent phosphatase-like protein [Cryomyces antarcticus]
MSRRRTRFACISDTHTATASSVKLPKGDVLIHAGDLTNQGSLSELRKSIDWIETADFEAKIVVAGNHDITLDADFYNEHGRYFHNQHPQDPGACHDLLSNSPSITYLNHQAATILLRSPTGPHTFFKVFGSPYSPAHGLWAFGYPPDKATKLWAAIPLDSDVVVTHTPPKNHCDNGTGKGCEALRRALWRVRPSMAVCGHIHEGRGVQRVRWNLGLPCVQYMEEGSELWTDPGIGNKKQSTVDLTSKDGNPIDNNGSRETSPTEQSSRSTSQSFKSRLGRKSRSAIIRGIAERSAAQFEEQRTSSGEEFSRLDEHDVEALSGRMGRKETCVINAAIMAASWGQSPKRFNKPIVVDIDLPVWEDAPVPFDSSSAGQSLGSAI